MSIYTKKATEVCQFSEDGDKLNVHLDDLPSGARYEDTYGEWLNIFAIVRETRRRLGFTSKRTANVEDLYCRDIVIHGCPFAWVWLFRWLRVTVKSARLHFPDVDPMIAPMAYHIIGPDFEEQDTDTPGFYDRVQPPYEEWFSEAVQQFRAAEFMTENPRGDFPYLDPEPRTFVEAQCALRPELADALWKLDMQWKYWPEDEPYLADDAPKVSHGKGSIFVTNHNSMYRREIVDYLTVLSTHEPAKKKKVVLVPCAADKPYPTDLHCKVKALLPSDDWYMATVTGALGLVPEKLWPIMPNYDAGVPNHWRTFQVVKDYFSRNRHEVIVVYSEFCSLPVWYALHHVAGGNVRGVHRGGDAHWRDPKEPDPPVKSMLMGTDMLAHFLFPIQPYTDYLPLHQERYIKRLEDVLTRPLHPRFDEPENAEEKP